MFNPFNPANYVRLARKGLRKVAPVKGLYVRAARQMQSAGLARAAKQIVICGYPRSGTSLLYNMMASALDGFHYESNEVSAVKYIAWSRDVISKRPLDVFELEELVRRNEYGKALHVIVVLRDLRDVVTSVHPRVPNDYFIGYAGSYRTDLPTGPAIVAPGVKAIYDQIERIRTMPGIKAVFVRYEDLVDDPEAVQATLSKELGVEFRAPFSTFHEKGEKLPYRYVGKWAAKDASLARETKPVDRARNGKWRDPEHRARIAEQFTRHPELLAMLRAYGYETDDGWFEEYRGNGGDPGKVPLSATAPAA